MATPYALLAVSDDDREEAAAVAYVAQHGGWRVTSADLSLIAPDMLDALVARANAVIVVWSASAADDPALNGLAQAAAAADKLIVVQLDHSAAPFADLTSIDASGWRDQPDPANRSRLLRALAECAARAPHAPGLSRNLRQPRRPPPVALGLAAGLIGLAGLAAAATALLNARNSQAAAKASIAQIAPVTPPASARASGAGQLSPVEAEAWRAVSAAQGAAETLAALQRYKTNFPDGAMLREALRLEQLERSLVMRAQQLLEVRGFAASDPPGELGRATTAAAAAFQASHDLPVDGRITLELIGALETAAPAPTRDPTGR